MDVLLLENLMKFMAGDAGVATKIYDGVGAPRWKLVDSSHAKKRHGERSSEDLSPGVQSTDISAHPERPSERSIRCCVL